METVTKEREERYKLEETVAELEEKLRDSEDSCSRAHKQIASLEVNTFIISLSLKTQLYS